MTMIVFALYSDTHDEMSDIAELTMTSFFMGVGVSHSECSILCTGQNGVCMQAAGTSKAMFPPSAAGALPLEKIIQDPAQNIYMQPGDVVTALFQPLSFTMLGAAGKSDEINFEAQGISLAQALARVGGMNDMRADAEGLFIFRYEDPAALNWAEAPTPGADGKVPVVYQVNLRDPSSFFIAQNFPVADHDVLFVANSAAADLQKFLNIVVGAVVYPALTVVNATR